MTPAHLADTSTRPAVAAQPAQRGTAPSASSDARLVRVLLVIERVTTGDADALPRSAEQAYASPGMAVTA